MSEVPAWHAIPADEVLRRLNTDPKKGLDTNEVSQRAAEKSSVGDWEGMAFSGTLVASG